MMLPSMRLAYLMNQKQNFHPVSEAFAQLTILKTVGQAYTFKPVEEKRLL